MAFWTSWEGRWLAWRDPDLAGFLFGMEMPPSKAQHYGHQLLVVLMVVTEELQEQEVLFPVGDLPAVAKLP